MGAIYVVRHAQASFGTEDYDRLSQTGFAQARLLGAYFALRNIRFDAAYTGTLRRHAETAQGIFDGHAGYGDGPRGAFARSGRVQPRGAGVGSCARGSCAARCCASADG